MLKIKVFLEKNAENLLWRIENWVHSNAIRLQVFFYHVDLEKCYFVYQNPSFVTPSLTFVAWLKMSISTQLHARLRQLEYFLLCQAVNKSQLKWIIESSWITLFHGILDDWWSEVKFFARDAIDKVQDEILPFLAKCKVLLKMNL